MRIKRFSALEGADFDKFLTAFCKIQEAVRVGAYRTGLSPYPAWIGFICQPTEFAKEFWIIEDNLGRAIGRIGANSFASHPKLGAIGFFEVDLKHPQAEEAGGALLTAAESWLKENRIEESYGPMNFNSWYQYRFCLPQEEAPAPYAWEPVHPPEYLEIWRQAGYQTSQTYESIARGDLAAQVESTKKVYDELLAKGYRFSPVDPLKGFDQDLKSIYDISMTGLRDGALFEPVSLAIFRGLHVALPVKTDFSHVAMDPSGKTVAFATAFEDQGFVVYRREASLPEFKNQGLEPALRHISAKLGLARGLSKSVTALTLIEQRQAKEAEPRSAAELWRRQYALLSKTLI